MHYRHLFADLLGEDPVRTDTTVHNDGPANSQTVPTPRSDRSDAERSDNRVDGFRPDATR